MSKIYHHNKRLPGGHLTPVSHAVVFESSPVHSVPPCSAAGSVHVRENVCVPDPHVTVQSSLLVHSAQFPLIAENAAKYCKSLPYIISVRH